MLNFLDNFINQNIPFSNAIRNYDFHLILINFSMIKSEFLLIVKWRKQKLNYSAKWMTQYKDRTTAKNVILPKKLKKCCWCQWQPVTNFYSHFILILYKVWEKHNGMEKFSSHKILLIWIGFFHAVIQFCWTLIWLKYWN